MKDDPNVDYAEGNIRTLPEPKIVDAKAHEWARLGLAAGFAATYLIIMLAATIYAIIVKSDQQTISTISSTILSPLGALVGSIIGFYFGTKKGE